MNRGIIVFLSLLLAGCAQVKQIQNLDPLLTLKAYSDENEEQEKWVDHQQKQFDELLVAVKANSIDLGSTKEFLLKSFGEPVVVDHIKENDAVVERWLYRHPIQKLATQRVYFYFTDQERMIRYELVPSLNERS